ncbi:MAG: lytic transglycosylase domain-containing protein, partial [Alphaproteobacteria bacterium]|nr:lytic transglycosylase domain-containing protein [Alphaproteobacteria bacterium]
MGKRHHFTLVPALLSAGAFFLFASAAAADRDGPEQAFVQAVEAGKHDSLAQLSTRIDDPLMQTYALWWRLQREETGASFAEIAAFLDEHPGWPRSNKLRRNAERAIDHTSDASDVVEFFATRPPLSGSGAIAHLDALKKLGRTDAIPHLAQAYWVNLNFNPGDEHLFLQHHGRQLDERTHIERLDRLIWDRVYKSAERMIKRVDAGEAAKAKARIALAKRANGVDSAIARVPAGLRDDPELAYERLQWRRAKDRDAAAAEILETYPGSERPRPGLWAKEARILARRAIDDGHYSEAARLAADHGLLQGGAFAESEFLAGWVRLAFLEEPNAAEAHFDRLYGGVKYPISRARAAYWKARAAEARGNDLLAREWY